MLKFIRYAIAALLFAASVGCLALWWRSLIKDDVYFAAESKAVPSRRLYVETNGGTIFLGALPRKTAAPVNRWEYVPIQRSAGIEELKDLIGREGRFGMVIGIAFFPLWYPVLVFAVAGVGVLRLGKPFTIRSALIAATVVAGLMGMAVIF